MKKQLSFKEMLSKRQGLMEEREVLVELSNILRGDFLPRDGREPRKCFIITGTQARVTEQTILGVIEFLEARVSQVDEELMK